MITFDTSDFRSLEEFPIKWRWTDSQWNELPNDALNGIQPFTDQKARQLLQYSLKFCDHKGLFESQFENISRIDASGNSETVTNWLIEQSQNKNQMVIVS